MKRLRRPGLWRWAIAAAMAAALLSLTPYLRSGTELARVRNALVFDAAPASAFDWSPDQAPASFLRDSRPPDAEFARVAASLELDRAPDDWARGVMIADYLLASAPQLVGGRRAGGPA